MIGIALSLLVAFAEGGTSWQGLSSTAIVFVNNRRIPVVHGSTVVLSKQQGKRVQDIGLCKTGVLDNCGVGLENLAPVPRGGIEKCTVLTGTFAIFWS